MIDRQNRDQLAEGIRALVSGQISNDEFEDKRVPRNSNDHGVTEIFNRGAWGLYSDLREYKLFGKNRLPAKEKAEIARWILFLNSDCEYEWPRPSVVADLLFMFADTLTLGMAGRFYMKHWRPPGDLEVWPFIRKEDYQIALMTPKYLNSTNNPKRVSSAGR